MPVCLLFTGSQTPWVHLWPESLAPVGGPGRPSGHVPMTWRNCVRWAQSCVSRGNFLLLLRSQLAAVSAQVFRRPVGVGAGCAGPPVVLLVAPPPAGQGSGGSLGSLGNPPGARPCKRRAAWDPWVPSTQAGCLFTSPASVASVWPAAS